MPRLVVEQGKDSGAEILVIDAVTVGRDLTCGLVLHDRQISRQHCRFEASGAGLKVRDLDSRNGILVNGVRTKEADLKPGDRVAVGTSVIRVAEGSLGAWSGKTVGGYRFLDKIGEGGMGEVYRSEQLSMHRFVAAKVLSAKLHEDPRYVERLLKEARAAAQLNHPALIQVHDVIQDPEITFFSMELVQGVTLREQLRKGPLTVSRALAVARQVAEALKYAHAKGIVHHDVKPENVMLSEDGRVKLADLGIAQPSGARLPENASGRRTLLGTPQYMPPDQITADRVDPRFDLYALGATFYHALGGRAPYRGGSPEEIVKQLVSSAPPPLVSLAPALPADVVAFVEKLMARNPEARFQTADLALKEIASLQSKYGDPDQPVSSPTGTGSVPTPPAVQAPGMPRAVLVVGILAVLLGVAWAVRQAVMPPPGTPAPHVPAPAPPPPPPPDRAALALDLLAAAEKALAGQDAEKAMELFRAYLREYPDQPGLGRAREAAGVLEAERLERLAERAWTALQADLAQAAEAVRIERLQRFAGDHPGSKRAKEALEQAARIQEERRRRTEALSAQADEEIRRAKTLAEASPPQFRKGIEALEAFLKANPDLAPGKREDVDRRLGALKSQKTAFWQDRMDAFQEALKQGQLPAARKVLESLEAMDEGWAQAAGASRAALQDAASLRFSGERKRADELLLAFEAAKAEKVLADLVQDLDGFPESARAGAWQEVARALAEAHADVLDRIEKKKPRACPIETPTGKGTVVGLDKDGNLKVQIPNGPGTARAWKDLSPAECLQLYRHYLGRQEVGAHYACFCLCWSRGLWEEAASEATMAKQVLEDLPILRKADLMKAFEEERPKP